MSGYSATARDLLSRVLNKDPVSDGSRYALAICEQDGASGVRCVVGFTQKSAAEKCEVRAVCVGLSPGKHGFHVHKMGNLSEGCKTAGPHFNPHNKLHGGPNGRAEGAKDSKGNPLPAGPDERHVGDLGNIVMNEGAEFAVYNEVDAMVSLFEGPNCIFGRSCVIHAGEDDLGLGQHELSTTTGNAGGRQACGVIGQSENMEININ